MTMLKVCPALLFAFMMAAALAGAAANPITIGTFEPSESPISEGETTTLSVTVQNTDENTSLTSSKAKVCLPSGLSFTTTNETCVTKTLTQDGQAEGTIASSGQASETWQIAGDVADSYEITVNAEGYLGSDKFTKDKDTSLTVTTSTPLTLSVIDDITGNIYPGNSFTLSALVSNTGGSDATGVETKLTSTCVTSSPASGVWRNVTSTGQSPGTVASGTSVSISWSVTAGSTTGSCGLYVDVVSDESGNPSDTHTITISSTGDGDGNGGNGGTPTGPSFGGLPANRSMRPTLVPGVGLRNNTKLQAAIEKVLARERLSEQARENLLRLSASIITDLSATRMFNVSAGKSRVTTRMRYTGQKRARNFMLFDSVPKSFANNASLVDVTAPAGTKTEIAEQDPSWVIYFPTLNPGQEFTVSYEVSGIKSSTVIDGMTTEIYAESLEDVAPPAPTAPICTAGTKRCSGDSLQQCSSDGTSWDTIESCVYGCDSASLKCRAAGAIPVAPIEIPWTLLVGVVIVAALVIVALAVYMKKFRKSSSTASALESVKQDLGQQAASE
jgi:hypothetical protein